MNLWERIKGYFSDPVAVRYSHGGARIPGVYITNENALQTAVVWACVNYLSKTVAQLPWRVLKERPDGGNDRQPTHPVNILLNRRPNSEMGPFTFKETMVGFACTAGNAVAEIQFDQRSMPIALWPIQPKRVQFRRSQTTGELMYQVDDAIPENWLAASQVFHLRGFGDGPVGLDVISYAARSIGWTRATEIFGSSYFAEGLHPSGVVTTKGRLTPDGYKNLRSELEARYGGPRKAGKPLILDGDMDWKAEAAEPQKSQFIETRQHQIEEICRWFGVPPHKVQHLLRATFTNIESQSIEVVQDSITPWVIRFEEEADHKLFGANRQGFFTKMDLKGLLRGDFQSRTAGYKTLWDMGVLSTNDIRGLEDMNPIGPAGDKRVAPLNMTTLEKLGEEVKVSPPPDERTDEDDDEDLTDKPSPVERARQQRALAERDIGENARMSAMVGGIQAHANIIAHAIRNAGDRRADDSGVIAAEGNADHLLPR